MESKYFLWMMLIISTLITLVIAYVSWKKRENNVALSCSIVMIAASFYSFGYAFEVIANNVEQIKVCLRIEYIGISFLTTLWFLLVMRYVGYDVYINKSMYCILFIIPLITLILNYTNDYHHLFYKDIGIEKNAYYTSAILTKGIWYWVHVGYSYLLLTIGIYFYIAMYLKALPVVRKQVLIMIFGAIIPWILNVIYLFSNNKYGLDLTPLGFVISCALYIIAIFKFNLLKLKTIALDYVFKAMEDGVIILDMQNNIINFNDSAKKIIRELEDFDIMKNSGMDLFSNYPDIFDKLSNIEGSNQQCIEGEFGKKYYRICISPIKYTDRVLGQILVLRDITEQKKMMRRLNNLAAIDELTQIYNRRYFYNECRKEIDRAKRYNTPFSFIIFDIDLFKRVNDTYGHHIGDQVLKHIVTIAKNNIRKSDIIARYGGEEFAIFLPQTYVKGAIEVAEKIRRIIANTPYLLDIKEIKVTSSFGVYGFEFYCKEELEEIIIKADRALYKAKENGRNKVVFYEEESN